MDPPNALNASTQALCGTTSHLSTVFYIKTYKCQSPYVYYNATSDLCQDGCSDYFLANTATILCQACHYTCQKCTLANSISSCSQC